MKSLIPITQYAWKGVILSALIRKESFIKGFLNDPKQEIPLSNDADAEIPG